MLPADVSSTTDYYPFGFQMSDRTLGGSGRFGFNGQEKTDEIAGKGNHNTALFWEYDTRVARRWNVDPVVKVHESLYAGFSNNPILYVDLFGDDTTIANNRLGNLLLVYNPDKFDALDYDKISQNEKYDIIEVNDPKNMRALEAKYIQGGKENIKNLVIAGHSFYNGAAGDQEGDAILYRSTDEAGLTGIYPEDIKAHRNGTKQNAYVKSLQEVTRYVGEGGNIFFTGCMLGLDRNGIATEMASAITIDLGRKFNVIFNNDPSGTFTSRNGKSYRVSVGITHPRL